VQLAAEDWAVRSDGIYGAIGDLTALRYADWKFIFMEQKTQGTLRVWMEPFTPLRIPLVFNLRRDPYERATITSNTYYDWLIDRIVYRLYGLGEAEMAIVDGVTVLD